MATRLHMRDTHPEPRKVAMAVDVLRKGGVIVYPTDTVYALGCDIMQKKAIDRIYQIKGMPKDHPVAFICPDLAELSRYAMVDDRAYRLMRRLLPGPYTLILESTREVPRKLMLKRKQVGIRIPAHDVPTAIVRELGHPIVSTSAVWNGEQLNDPDELMDRFRSVDMVIDAGWGGIDPSTVLDLTGGEIEVVREGAGSLDALQ